MLWKLVGPESQTVYPGLLMSSRASWSWTASGYRLPPACLTRSGIPLTSQFHYLQVRIVPAYLMAGFGRHGMKVESQLERLNKNATRKQPRGRQSKPALGNEQIQAQGCLHSMGHVDGVFELVDLWSFTLFLSHTRWAISSK